MRNAAAAQSTARTADVADLDANSASGVQHHWASYPCGASEHLEHTRKQAHDITWLPGDLNHRFGAVLVSMHAGVIDWQALNSAQHLTVGVALPGAYGVLLVAVLEIKRQPHNLPEQLQR